MKMGENNTQICFDVGLSPPCQTHTKKTNKKKQKQKNKKKKTKITANPGDQTPHPKRALSRYPSPPQTLSAPSLYQSHMSHARRSGKKEKREKSEERKERKKKKNKNLFAGVLVQGNKLLADVLNRSLIVAAT